jgi:hypothetical protein
LNPALLFLVRRSLRNAVVQKLKRLRNPRYLLLFLVGAAYFALVLGVGRGGGGPPSSLPPGITPTAVPDAGFDAAVFYEWGAVALALLLAAGAWVLPSRQAPLNFLESEVAMLFPAPLSRRELVSYKLLDTQKTLLLLGIFVGLMTTIISGPLRGIAVVVGFWLAFSVLTFHQVGAHLTRKSLLDHGASGWKRMGIPLLVLAGLGAVVVLGAPPLPDLRTRVSLDEVAKWLVALGESPAGWVLYPFRLLARSMLAKDPGSLAIAAGQLAALGAVLYLWVIRTDAAFEEAAAEHATRLARQIEAAKRGKFWSGEKARTAPRRNPWRLGAAGPPETAFLWKSVAETLRGISPRLVGILVAAVVIGLTVGMKSAPEDVGAVLRTVGGAVMLVGAGLLVFAGPTILGSNLRQDMEQVELLKTLPLAPGRLVRCALAGAVFPTAIGQAALVAGAAILMPDPRSGEITLAWRIAGGCGLAFLLPALAAISATVDAAGVLFFPAWVRPGQPPAQGVEAMGYGIVVGIAKFLLLGFGMVVPGIVGGLLVLVASLGGPAALAAGVWLGALAAAGVALLEVGLLSEALGRRFARLDPSEEGILS